MTKKFSSTKIIELGSCAFRQWKASGTRVNAGPNSDRCSKVHGYRLQAKFWFSAKELDERNWVADFGSLKPLKEQLQNQFDHTLCVAKDDPLVQLFQELHDNGGCDLRIMDAVGIEKTAEYCFNVANEYVKQITENRCWVEKVEVWEHEGNSAIYEETKTSLENTLDDWNQKAWDANDVANLNNIVNFTISTQELHGAPVSESPVIELPTVTEPVPAVVEPEPAPQHQRGASVGNKVTTGKGNWFSGTTWG
tara:strand:+ start:118 stop:870 length:753 start_codon:yes stop_codon:yes gene_type:complete